MYISYRGDRYYVDGICIRYMVGRYYVDGILVIEEIGIGILVIDIMILFCLLGG